jgi:CheY-like chemotaxis protein
MSLHTSEEKKLSWKKRTRLLRILMVDDSEHDIHFVKHALDASGVGKSFNAVHNAEEAISYLRADDQYADRTKFPFPNVIFTDLKMPLADGYSLLTWLNAHPTCSVIPTIVFSSSGLREDVARVYQHGANAYIVKPNTLEELVHIIKITYSFWCICEIPDPPKDQRCP